MMTGHPSKYLKKKSLSLGVSLLTEKHENKEAFHMYIGC